MEKRIWEPEMESMPMEKMREYQREKLLFLVRWAYEKSPFYRRKYDDAGTHPRHLKTLNDITKLPFIYKDDLRHSQERVPPYGEHCISPGEIVRTYWSTGTTGRPTYMGVSKREARYWDGVIARSLYASGLRKGDLFYHATQLSSFAGGFGFLTAAQLIGANIIPAGAGNTERHIHLIGTLKPNFIKILPSYANYMAEVALKQGIDLRHSAVKRLYLSAEPSPPPLKGQIEQKWDAVAFDSYGLSDVGQPQCYECEEHEGLHDIPDWNYTEIIDPESLEPIEEIGKEGILVYTNLVRRTMPIIRFWTNDVSSWVSFEPCRCGRTTARISPVYRRMDETIKVKGVNLWPSAVAAIIAEQSALSGQHQVIIETRDGRDFLKIVAEARESITEFGRLKELLAGKFQAGLFIKVDEIEIVPFGTLPQFEHKAKILLDRRNK